MRRATIILCLVIYAFNLVSSQKFGFGVFTVQLPKDEEVNFCIKYYPTLFNITSNKSEAVIYSLDQIVYLEEADTCQDENIPDDLTGKIALIPTQNKTINGNCTLKDRAQTIAGHSGNGVIADQPLPSKFNASDYEAKILVAALYHSSDVEEILELQKKHSEAKFYLYSPKIEKLFDFSLLVILGMAIFTVSVGSMWSGYTKKRLLDQKNNCKKVREPSEGGENEDQEQIYGEKESNHSNREEISLQVTPILIVGFVFCMCMMLLMLYFFFDKLVYIIIGMFCIASFIAIYSCLEPLVLYSYEVFPRFIVQFPQCKLCCITINMELRQFILMSFALSITIVWLVFRKETWAWALQDLLGIVFSLNMLKTLRLPSLKVITVLLNTLFVYDIFFVFITPYLTKDGKSVMVEVATGGEDATEQLPMVLKVPHLSSDPLITICNSSPGVMLGFGDILVPGLLVSFCHAYDLQKGSKCWTYWILTNVFYALGMVATFISLFVMDKAQPALLYLVPFTLIPVFIVAFAKGDLGTMWQGDFHNEEHRKVETAEVEANGHVPNNTDDQEELRQEANEAK